MDDNWEYAFEGASPTVHEDARVSRGATLVGDVRVGRSASVWPGAVLRGDVAPVVVGEESAVGDNAVLHASEVGERAMVGHGAVLNEAVVEDSALVGFNATVNSGVVVGERSIVAAGTVFPEEMEVPPRSFVRGVPARVTPFAETDVDADEIFEDYHSGRYADLASRHEELFEREP
ncbi:MAG: gamma carbonic anhydrase family protein [Haloferacaceae archaeon]